MKEKMAWAPTLRLVQASALIILSALFSPPFLYGADITWVVTRPAYALTKGMNEFGLWAGGSPSSNIVIGKTPNTRLFLAGLRYGRVLAAWDSFSLEYTLDIIPAAEVFQPDRERTRHSRIYGAGLSPVAIKINFGQQGWVKPFITAGGGFLYFAHDVPVSGSSRFNFTPGLGAGIEAFLTPRTAAILGYNYLHMSNAGISRRNPGVDSNVIYAGFSFFTP